MFFQTHKNGRVQELGGEEVAVAFEDRIVVWNTETSGWDAEHNFWTIKARPPLSRIPS